MTLSSQVSYAALLPQFLLLFSYKYCRWSESFFFDAANQVGVEVFSGLVIRRQLTSVVIEWSSIRDIRIHELVQVFFDEAMQEVAVLF